ncbi:MAG TPA: hypothetical protein VFG63_04435 [Nocardioidaceae bacterium]|nr:hypothetical protein [Nocardioidaceae bacterium]
MAVLGLAPTANADGQNPDLGRARNSVEQPAPDPGRARNDIGNYVPPADNSGPAGTDFDTSDAVVGSLAGLLVAAGGIGVVVSVRRRHETAAHHPA